MSICLQSRREKKPAELIYNYIYSFVAIITIAGSHNKIQQCFFMELTKIIGFFFIAHTQTHKKACALLIVGANE